MSSESRAAFIIENLGTDARIKLAIMCGNIGISAEEFTAGVLQTFDGLWASMRQTFEQLAAAAAELTQALTRQLPDLDAITTTATKREANRRRAMQLDAPRSRYQDVRRPPARHPDRRPLHPNARSTI